VTGYDHTSVPWTDERWISDATTSRMMTAHLILKNGRSSVSIRGD